MCQPGPVSSGQLWRAGTQPLTHAMAVPWALLMPAETSPQGQGLPSYLVIR